MRKHTHTWITKENNDLIMLSNNQINSLWHIQPINVYTGKLKTLNKHKK